MKPLSYSQRLAAGLGVIALGVCAALPFRRPAELPNVVPTPPAESGLGLSTDVALQLPGQPATDPTEFTAAVQWDAASAEEADDGATETIEPDTLAMVPLPSMPDRFQPLEDQPTAATVPQGVISEPPQLPTREKPARRHRIRDGDTLESLALRYLNDEHRADEIFAANRGLLADPALLPIGIELVIPTSEPAGETSEPSPSVTAVGELVPLPQQFKRFP